MVFLHSLLYLELITQNAADIAAVYENKTLHIFHRKI